MKKVKCKSGLTGWQCRLRKNYNNFEQFEYYSEMWGIAKRLGFNSHEKAWNKNPTIRASVEPSDLEVVKDKSWRVIEKKEYKLHSEEGTIISAKNEERELLARGYKVKFISRGKNKTGCYVYKLKTKK